MLEGCQLPSQILIRCLGTDQLQLGLLQVALQLVEQAALELVPDEEVKVRRLVQVVAVRFHGTDLLKGIMSALK